MEAGAVAHRVRRTGSGRLTPKKAAPASQATPRAGGTRYAAFLRAINVGGRNVTMERLREVFASVPGTPVRDVETFIASGNVVFTTGAKDIAALERRIADQLRDALGYEVATFVRAVAELEVMARANHFPEAAEGHAVHVGFLQGKPAPDAATRLMALDDAINTFALDGRELWWWSRGRISDSGIEGGRLERALGMPMTMRNVNTVRRLAAKYGTPPTGA